MCKTFQCLPESGGLLDQDWLVVQRFMRIEVHLAEKAEIDRKKAEAKRAAK